MIMITTGSRVNPHREAIFAIESCANSFAALAHIFCYLSAFENDMKNSRELVELFAKSIKDCDATVCLNLRQEKMVRQNWDISDVEETPSIAELLTAVIADWSAMATTRTFLCLSFLAEACNIIVDDEDDRAEFYRTLIEVSQNWH